MNSPRPGADHPRRALTSMTLMAGVVLLVIVTGILWASNLSGVSTARDGEAALNLDVIAARVLAASASNGTPVVWAGDLVEPRVTADPAGRTVTVAGVLVVRTSDPVDDNPSTGPGEVSVAADAAGRIGLAVLSRTGACLMAKIDPGPVPARAELTLDPPPGPCSGAQALTQVTAVGGATAAVNAAPVP